MMGRFIIHVKDEGRFIHYNDYESIEEVIADVKDKCLMKTPGNFFVLDMVKGVILDNGKFKYHIHPR